MDKQSTWKTWLAGTIFWVFGIATCAFYAVSTLQVCAQQSGMLALFWPLLVIPVANLAVLLLGKAGISSKKLLILSALNSVGLAVSILLTTVLSPLCVLACLGIIIGFTALSLPLIGFCLYHLLVAIGPLITTMAMRHRLRMLKPSPNSPFMPLGAAAALTLMLVLTAVFPALLTDKCLNAAGEEQTRKQAILLLRAFGDNEAMLRACYDQHVSLSWWFMLASDLNGDYSDEPSAARLLARENYYRATGQPFNSVKRPSGTHSYYLWDDEIEWWTDHDFAGATVGGIVKSLTLTKSNIDGWVDSDEGVSHLNWRMHFKHTNSSRAELRAEVLLPPQAVVSGCSLWIGGVRHDAIIGSRISTRQAYQSSASNGERPFMVSTAGPGRVLIQSSTGYWGDGVDLELDLTAPVSIIQKDSAALRLPVFAERNFAVTATHSVNIAATTSGATQSIKKELSENAIKSSEGTLNLKRDPNFVIVSATVPYLAEGSELLEKLESSTAQKQVPVSVVLDGSASMSTYVDAVCRALSEMNFPDATLVWASDSPQVLVSHVDTNSLAWKKAVSNLRDAGCVGGQDNAQALLMALQENKSNEAANVVWIHGPQPAKLSSERLPLALANSRGKLFEYQVSPAPNELLRLLDRSPNLYQLGNFKDTESDLKDFFRKLSGAEPLMMMTGSIETAGIVQSPTAKHANELAQVFINQMISNNLGDPSKFEELGVMAQKASIVTPLTSALVLEQQSDYTKYEVKQYGKKAEQSANTAPQKGLIPNPASFAGQLIPVKPEPPMWLLVLCATMIMAGLAWIKRRFKHA